MPMMSISQIVKALCNAPTVVVDGSQYKELINVQYEVIYRRPDDDSLYPDTEDDKEERRYILNHADNMMKLFEEDINTRRAVFPITYENGFGKCVCLVHLFIRDRRLFINEYYRSQNFQRNYEYDCETACLVMEQALRHLNEFRVYDVDKIGPGMITVFCANLHLKM